MEREYLWFAPLLALFGDFCRVRVYGEQVGIEDGTGLRLLAWSVLIVDWRVKLKDVLLFPSSLSERREMKTRYVTAFVAPLYISCAA